MTVNEGTTIAVGSDNQGARSQITGINKSAEMEKAANQLIFVGRIEAATINHTAATEPAHWRLVSAVVTEFFRVMDRLIEEMKPNY